MKGLKAGTKRGRVNWQSGIKAAKQGAKRAIKRKATQVSQKAKSKDTYLEYDEPHVLETRETYSSKQNGRMYKDGSLFMAKSKQPDYRWVQTALKAAKKRKRKRKRRRR